MKAYRLGVAALVASFAAGAGLATPAAAADRLLSGTVTSMAGEKLDGVTVSA